MVDITLNLKDIIILITVINSIIVLKQVIRKRLK